MTRKDTQKAQSRATDEKKEGEMEVDPDELQEAIKLSKLGKGDLVANSRRKASQQTAQDEDKDRMLWEAIKRSLIETHISETPLERDVYYLDG